MKEPVIHGFRGVFYGCKSIEDVIMALELEVNYFKTRKDEGYEVKDVEDDYVSLSPPDNPELPI